MENRIEETEKDIEQRTEKKRRRKFSGKDTPERNSNTIGRR